MAEVDYMVSYDGKMNSVEAKSDTEGKVRSLHSFMEMAPHNLAVRFYVGEWAGILEENEEGNLFQYWKDGY